MDQVTALILAAGEGKRMKSDKAKVMHRLCGKAMIEWVLEAVKGAGIEKCVAIVGHKAEQITEYMGNRLEYVFQKERLGTGHAVKQAYRYYSTGAGYILVLCGDVPLISSSTIKNAIEYLKNNNYDAVVITADFQNPDGYGRVVRDRDGNFAKIVEHRDANETERAIKEINSGMYVFLSKALAEAIELLGNNNDQKEYYLTDTLEIIRSKGYRVGVFKVADSDEVLGVNDKSQLEQVAAILGKRIGAKKD